MSTRRARLLAFAKLNLTLEVLNRRPDGFHNIRTVFQTISLHDVIDVEIRRASVSRVEVSANVDIPGENLIVQAAHRVLEACEVSAEIRFVLDKRIPMGGGLGGGSADAGAVLRALPRLLESRLPVEQLHAIASGLGSDVPFFLLGGTAAGLGRGTELYPLPDARADWGLLITPGLHVSTPDAFRALGRTAEQRSAEGMSPTETMSFAIGNQWSWESFAVNHFEPAMFARHPELASFRSALETAGASLARMTGSGSTLFGIFPSQKQRDQAAEAAGASAIPFRFVSRFRYLRALGMFSPEK